MPRTPNQQQDLSPADDTCVFWTVFLLAFGLLFVVAVMVKLVGLPWRRLFPGADNSPGLVQGVNAAVHTLMSRIA